MKDKFMFKEDRVKYKKSIVDSKKRLISRNPNGTTVIQKCAKEGCNKMVKRTASVIRLGRGLYCSRIHIPHKGLAFSIRSKP